MSYSRMTAWTMWVVVSVFYAYQYILRVMPNVMLDDIMSQFKIDAATFGQFSGVYYVGYSLMHLPIGIMLDRFGPKRVMTACILLAVAGLLPLIFTDHWIYPIIGRIFLGIGSSAAILGLFKIIRMTFNEKYFPRILSYSVTIGLMGAIYGGAPLGYMCEFFGYQTVIKIFAFVGILLALLTYWIIPDAKTLQHSTVVSDIKEVLSNYRIIFSCIFAGLMVGPLEGFADVWGTVFLKQCYGFEVSLATSLPSMIFIGMCFGAPILSLIAEKIGSHLITIISAGFIMAISLFAMLTWQLTPEVLSICFILIGICSAYQILAIYQISTYASEKVASLSTAIANMMIMFFGYAFHTAIGSTIKTMGGTMQSKALIYGISVVPIALSVGTMGFVYLFFINQSKKAKLQTVQQSMD